MKRCFLAGNLVLIFMLTSLILGDEIPILWAQDKPGLAAEWERTVAAARKEGQVTIFFIHSSGLQALMIPRELVKSPLFFACTVLECYYFLPA